MSPRARGVRTTGSGQSLLEQHARVVRACRPKEKDVEAACDRLMVGLGYTPIRFSQPRNTMQTPGIPDRRYYKADRMFPPAAHHSFWFECKRPGGKQSPAQLAFQQLVVSCGEQYVLGGLDELARYLIAHAPLGRLQREALIAQFVNTALPRQFAEARKNVGGAREG